jgi:hypothetical protein
MLAAALTVWILFSFWLTAPLIRVPPRLRRIGAALLWAELAALLVYSYGVEGCLEDTCAPLAQAAGIAARTDLPILAGAFLAITCAHVARASITAHGRRAAPGHARERARDL